MTQDADVGTAVGRFVRRLTPARRAAVAAVCDFVIPLIGPTALEASDPRVVAVLTSLSAACVAREVQRKRSS